MMTDEEFVGMEKQVWEFCNLCEDVKRKLQEKKFHENEEIAKLKEENRILREKLSETGK